MAFFVDIKNVPEIDQNSDADSEDSQYTVDLGTPCACHECARCNKPRPPFHREFTAMTSARIHEEDVLLTGNEASGNEYKSR